MTLDKSGQDTSLNVGGPDSTALNGVLAMVYIAYTLVGLTGPYYRALLGLTTRPWWPLLGFTWPYWAILLIVPFLIC